MNLPRLCLIPLAALMVVACGETAKLPFEAGVGPNPQLPAPNKTLIPTLKIAEASGWTDTAGPTAASGFKVTALARQLDHPRWVYTLPNGDVLVAESNKPPKEPGAPQAEKGLFDKAKGVVQGLVMKRAGAEVPSANRITLLRDANNDGVAETRSVFIQGLNSPFGVALVNGELFIANADALVKVPYADGQTTSTAAPVKVTDLPAGINHHWTKNVIASPDGQKLYVTVGSNSNVGENGLDKETGRAAIWEYTISTKQMREYATGLRNPNGLGFEPVTGKLWTAVNERDEIGSDLVPDYITSVQEGGFYGWPYSYWGNHVDARVEPQKPDLVAKAIAPDYAVGTHTASLGIAFSQASSLPEAWKSGLFVAQHGSWNRRPKSGYKVIYVPFKDGKPTGQPVDALTGFLNADEKAQGRPVGVILDKTGALLVSDDVGKTIWRVSASTRTQ